MDNHGKLLLKFYTAPALHLQIKIKAHAPAPYHRNPQLCYLCLQICILNRSDTLKFKTY